MLEGARIQVVQCPSSRRGYVMSSVSEVEVVCLVHELPEFLKALLKAVDVSLRDSLEVVF